MIQGIFQRQAVTYALLRKQPGQIPIFLEMCYFRRLTSIFYWSQSSVPRLRIATEDMKQECRNRKKKPCKYLPRLSKHWEHQVTFHDFLPSRIKRTRGTIPPTLKGIHDCPGIGRTKQLVLAPSM